MKKVTFEVPTMYGDHHVIEVRRILMELPGVEDVFASSSFRVVEVTYDPDKINDLELAVKLDESGYLGEWTVVAEKGLPVVSRASDEVFFRHTEVYEHSKQVVSFAQNVNYVGRPLWPCPGMGVVKPMEEEN
jgi:copper chaperone CopZ